MDQMEYWNRVSEEKEFTTPETEFSRYVRKDARIADIVCGYGRTLDQLRRLGYTDLIGFDFSDGMIRRGKRLFPELDLRIKNGSRIELEDASVDAVVLFAVLTCIPGDSDQDTLLAEIWRILRPDGILYVNDFLLNDDARNRQRYERFAQQFGCYGVFELPEGAVLRHFTQDRVFSLLSGFTVNEYEPLVFTTMNGNRSNGFYLIGTKKRPA